MPATQSTVRNSSTGTRRDYALWALTLGYLLSQFFRSYVAVIAPQLISDFGFTPGEFGLFAGSFFFIFALLQLPLGLAFDRFGIGPPVVACMAVGTAGAVALPMTHSAAYALAAQAALGFGCAPIFMGLLNHVLKSGYGARQVHAVTTASAIGIVGALLAALPLAWSSARLGWRASMGIASAGMLLATCAVALAFRTQTGVTKRDKREVTAAPPVAAPRRAFLTLLPVCFAMSAGGVFRTSWGGPYLADVFHLDIVTRGQVMTAASLAAFAVSLLIPFVVRLVTAKTLSLGCMATGLLAAIILAVQPAHSVHLSVALICVLFSVGAIHPLVMSQARSVTSPGQLGLRLGILNSMVFLGVAVTSNCFGWIAEAALRSGLPASGLYAQLFLFTTALLAAGTLSYIFSPRLHTSSKS
ncbi:MFS transporter [Paraburkholderia sp. J76]|uniref:MFS transporter n=1 Tax=Paraburkholderia sp. J76 TaxID=2805439 RepID=UPI002ABE2994|nr:MFS transporter [Paraburkholderia sp. J76]